MLTDKEQAILDFIRAYVAKYGKSPKYNEIGVAISVESRGAIYNRLKALELKGYLVLESGWRGIKLTTPPNSLPLLGKIAAGKPIEAVLTPEIVELGTLFSGLNRYMLEVKGESMIDIGIMDGDLAVIHKADTANDGQIVVALIDNENASLKRLQRSNNKHIKLIPENKTMEPIICEADRVQIQGILVGVIRKY